MTEPIMYFVTQADGTERIAVFTGRRAWALDKLSDAGEAGCTPIDTPGPRWSGYVHRLRGGGIDIETIPEPHNGPFPGTHARYVLRSLVRRITPADGSEQEAA